MRCQVIASSIVPALISCLVKFAVIASALALALAAMMALSKELFFLVFALADPSPGPCLRISCFRFKWRSCQARRYGGTVGGGRVDFAELAFYAHVSTFT